MSETTITVTGHAETELPPERVTASISLQFDGSEPLPAIEAATELAGKVGGELRELHDPANGPVTAWSSDQLRTWSARPWNADGAELPPVHHVAIGIRAEFSDFEALTSWLGWVAVLSGVSVDAINWTLLDETRDAGARRTARPRRRGRVRQGAKLRRRGRTVRGGPSIDQRDRDQRRTGAPDERGLASDSAAASHSSSRRHRSRSRPPSKCASRRADRYSPRWRRLDIARAASRLSCCSRRVWRLSYSRLPLATASSTLARPSLK